MTEPVYVVHQEPSRWDPPFDTAYVSLAPRLTGQVEQLWLKNLGERLFRIVCVPFLTDGLAYLDVLALDPAGGPIRVHERSGHRVLRVMWQPKEVSELAGFTDALVTVSEFLGIAHEHHGDRFIAFDIAPGVDAQELVGSLDKLAAEGHLNWEWGD
ncbi:DUF4265 domain-containing protein [Krasilnikovia sp. M28-CT-15]|uniref:DUF4265 domain-containing protein n=1 Tax=Krasilnikovia sp. M28-CT-15 TaxID=3373540 RepID=UPI003876693D